MSPRGTGREPLVVVHRDLVEVTRRQIADSPRVETGGKFVGYVVPSAAKIPKSAYGKQVAGHWREILRKAGKGRTCLFLVGSISPGPLAKRTAMSLLPDGAFQSNVFQVLERAEPDLEHLGTWHSHHPNGVRRFSGGDIEHYESVIADRNHGPDHYVAALCFDAKGFGLFEIFSRKGARRAPLGAEQLIVDDGFPSLQPALERAEAEVISVGGLPSPFEAALRSAFTVRERRDDGDATSWVVQSSSGPEFLGVVTRTAGPRPHVALSVNMAAQGISLQYDSTEAANSAPARKLTSELLGVVESLAEAVRRGGKSS